MQYINPTSMEANVLYFNKPVEYDTLTNLKFTSYVANFEVVPTVTELHNFISCSFLLTSEQAAYFSSSTEFKVQFGSAKDLTRGITSELNVIEYSPDDE